MILKFYSLYFFNAVASQSDVVMPLPGKASCHPFKWQGDIDSSASASVNGLEIGGESTFFKQPWVFFVHRGDQGVHGPLCRTPHASEMLCLDHNFNPLPISGHKI